MLERAAMRDLGGKFRVLAELGQGGSSRVWLSAMRGPRGFNKLVVLKSMKDELRSEPDLAQMFLNEAKLAAQLSHPNIVQTYEVFEHEARPVIVMEYLDGQALATILSRSRPSGGFPQHFQLRVLSEALAGLHAAHELKDYGGLALEVVHRDVSPHNIFVTYDGQAKVIDFGIAKLTGLAEATESGVIRGRLHYMAPEQMTAGRIDRRADIYSAGVMLWEILTGVRMWRGVNEAVVMNRVLGGNLPDLLAINPSTSPRLARMAARATALVPEDRYPSAAEFQEDIDSYLGDTGQEPRSRELGEAVAKLFLDRRQERQAIVLRELRRVSEQSDDEYAGYQPVALTALETHAENATQMRRRLRRERVRGTVPWLVVSLLAGALLLALVRLAAPERRPPGATLANTTTSPPPAAAAHETARLGITAYPRSARIVLDGEPLPDNPFHGQYPLDASRVHTIEINAVDHQAEQRTIRFDRDQQLVVTLDPAQPPARKAPLPSKARTKPRTAATTPAGPANASAVEAKAPADCEPPYYFDERGVKKFKTGCL
jgi:eukaryotic-like serine/threonine-protein kinase